MCIRDRAYGDSYSQGLYYLSSIADKVLLNPQGMVEWRGLAATPMFFKDLLAKIGVEMQIFKVGTYKSAVEPFISTEMSPANREQIDAYLTSIWGQVTNDVAESRKISVDSLNAIADRMLMFYPAEESVQCGLVDTLIYKNDVRDYLKNMVGIDKDDNMPVLGIQDMINVKKNVPRDKSGNVIAVYYAYGEIDGGSSASTDEGINSEKVIKDLRKLKDDENVKAVVLRVNSPGGSAYISEQIWKEVVELKAKKPIVVSMGNYAASGGYYISCAANKIVAERTTLTGSIGVFGVVRNFTGTFDKVGVTTDIVKTNTFADLGDISRPMREDEKALIQRGVEQTYDLFLTRCADGRGMTKAEIDSIGQGRVWTGEQALERGLVDQLGGMDDAIKEAATLAELTDYSVIVADGPKDFFTKFMEKQMDEAKVSIAKSVMGEEQFKLFSTIRRAETESGIIARMPFDIKGL